MRIGFGYDVHKLVEGRKLILGGVTIPADKGLLGHSDADALCHAVGDAILGSVALGDLGTHFPDDDEQFAGISSLLILKEIGKMLAKEGYQINNIDATLVLEKPKLLPYIPTMRKNVAQCLALLESQVSIKATTSEMLGFTGREDGMVAYASVLVEKRVTHK
ncbi:MAG: 2-C-methyl-D-erythritol 2,4-cyclodiphosphate synthase [bacterium]